LGALLLLLWALGGCATYSAKMADLRPELTQGHYDEALEIIERKTGSKDQLLYWLERGIVLHYADRWTLSNEAFAVAERTADELYTKSVSEGVFSLFSNDNAISYRARPFELAMVPYFKAMNYIYLGDRSAAQVEARRASLQQAKFVDATLGALREEDRSVLERVKSNAFLLYTSGMLYDWDGALNDAFTAYRNAAVAYQDTRLLLQVDIPPALASDLERVAGRLGFGAEIAELRRSCPDVFAHQDADSVAGPAVADSLRSTDRAVGTGEVVVFLESGYVSHKTEIRFDMPIFESGTYDSDYWAWELYGGMGDMHALVEGRSVEYWVSVAAPAMQDRKGPFKSVRVRSERDGPGVEGYRIENLSRHARITFDAEKPSIFVKTMLRGAAKYGAAEGAEEAGGEIAKLLVNIFGSVTESADTRSWLTLPADVFMVRMTLPAGVHNLTAEMTDRQGRPLGRLYIPGVEVAAGDWTFVSRRVF